MAQTLTRLRRYSTTADPPSSRARQLDPDDAGDGRPACSDAHHRRLPRLARDQLGVRGCTRRTERQTRAYQRHAQPGSPRLQEAHGAPTCALQQPRAPDRREGLVANWAAETAQAKFRARNTHQRHVWRPRLHEALAAPCTLAAPGAPLTRVWLLVTNWDNAAAPGESRAKHASEARATVAQNTLARTPLAVFPRGVHYFPR